ncbi:hypothetical protein [Mariprofundus micogutta]|nr:hypothetical protein [Mariprofundus micogutta]
MAEGYVKLSRKIRDSWMIQGDHDALAVFIYLLTSATHKPHKVVVDGQVIELLPGQVLGGRKRLAKVCGLTEKQIRRILKLFENAEIAAMKGAAGRAKAVSVITLMNWGLYQSNGDTGAKVRASDGAEQGPKEGQTRATDKNGKKGKNGKKEDKPREKTRTSSVPDDFRLDDNLITWTTKEDIKNPEKYIAEFVDYWKSKGDKKSDWHATFRNYLRSRKEKGWHGGLVHQQSADAVPIQCAADMSRVALEDLPRAL